MSSSVRQVSAGRSHPSHVPAINPVCRIISGPARPPGSSTRQASSWLLLVEHRAPARLHASRLLVPPVCEIRSPWRAARCKTAKGHLEFWLTFRWKDKSETGVGGWGGGLLKPHLTPAQQTPPRVALTSCLKMSPQGPSGRLPCLLWLSVCTDCGIVLAVNQPPV